MRGRDFLSLAGLLPGVAGVFVRLGVALRLDEGVHGSLQQLAAEAAVQLGDGVSWKNIKKHQARFTCG